MIHFSRVVIFWNDTVYFNPFPCERQFFLPGKVQHRPERSYFARELESTTIVGSTIVSYGFNFLVGELLGYGPV